MPKNLLTLSRSVSQEGEHVLFSWDTYCRYLHLVSNVSSLLLFFLVLVCVQRRITGPSVRTCIWKGLCIGSKEQTCFPEPVQKCPNKLQIRQLFQYEPLSEELREKLQLSLKVVQSHLFILPMSDSEETNWVTWICSICLRQKFCYFWRAISASYIDGCAKKRVFLKQLNCFHSSLVELTFLCKYMGSSPAHITDSPLTNSFLAVNISILICIIEYDICFNFA